MNSIRSVAALLACVCAAPAALGEEWTEFRGPTAQGHSSAKGLPLEWGPDKNVVWKTPVPGLGWSSPVCVQGRIYLTTAVPEGGKEKADANRSLRALALDAKDGRLLWNVEVFPQNAKEAPKIHGKNSHASPTPVWEAGKLYVHFGHQGTACLDADTGSVLWSTREFAYEPVHGNGGSPILVGDLLVYNADARAKPAVLALDKNTGKLRWRYERVSDAGRKFSFGTPLLIEVNGQKQIVSPGSNLVCGLDPKDGAEIWRVRYQGYSLVPRPVFAHGMLFMATGYDAPEALAIKVDGKGDVTDTHIVWRLAKGAPHNPSMVVVGPHLYMVADSGLLSCVDAKKGEVLYKERATGAISSSLLHAEGRVYLQDESGKATVVKAGATFEVLGRSDLGEKTLASYAVLGSDLLIRTDKHLWRVGTR
jgi:outer membrane protein assembly factor BamB